MLDWSNPPFAKWFVGGKLNVSYNCLDRHVEAGNGDRVAFHWRGEEGEERDVTYADLLRDVKRLAGVLKERGIEPGDVVGIFLPMIPEVAVAMLACARIGAIHSVVFGGFSPDSLAGRIADCDACAVITADEGVRGFLVPAGTPGFSTRDIERKLSLRASVTSELVLEDCRLPGDAVLPEVRGMRGPLSCLNEARYGIVWGSMGAARACFQSALEYSRTRVQFDRPIGGFQLTQQKLADMLVELSKGTLLALHLGRMKDDGRLAPEQVSLGKLNNVREALAIARDLDDQGRGARPI